MQFLLIVYQKLEPTEIHELEGTEVIKVRDEVVNVLSIKELFRLPSRYTDIKSYYAVIISSYSVKLNQFNSQI